MVDRHVFLDFFAGCGGLSLGLENAGFFPIYVNELNESAMDTYLSNRKNTNPLLETKFHSNDIKSLVTNPQVILDLRNELISEYQLTDFDLIVGGPPCQGFSGIGHRRSYSIDKEQLPSNHLYQDYAFVISQFRPKIFLFENVRGLIFSKWTKDGKKGEIWEDVQRAFSQIPGYTIKSSLIRAKDYGVPQNRPRVLLVGIRDDIMCMHVINSNKVADGFLPEPQGLYPSLEDLLGDLIDPNYVNGGNTILYPRDPMNELQTRLRSIPDELEQTNENPMLTEHKYSRHSERIIQKFTYMLNNNGQIPEHLMTKKFSQRLLPTNWDNNGPFITATSMPDDYVHFCQPRTLTVREWARLQLFPDWYQFKGNRTTGGIRRAGNPREGQFEREIPKYTQIGNAVPVKLAEEIGKHFMGILQKNNSETNSGR